MNHGVSDEPFIVELSKIIDNNNKNGFAIVQSSSNPEDATFTNH